MGTYSRTYIKSTNIESIIKLLKVNLTIGSSEWSKEKMDWFGWIEDRKNRTIILSMNDSRNWIEIDFDFNGNQYLYDEMLRIISKELNTEILLGYYQSTSGEGRIAKFFNGELIYTYYERYYENPPNSRIYVADNWKINLSKLEQIKKTKLDEESNLFDLDLLTSFFYSEGFAYDSELKKDEWKYLHLEQKK